MNDLGPRVEIGGMELEHMKRGCRSALHTIQLPPPHPASSWFWWCDPCGSGGPAGRRPRRRRGGRHSRRGSAFVVWQSAAYFSGWEVGSQSKVLSGKHNCSIPWRVKPFMHRHAPLLSTCRSFRADPTTSSGCSFLVDGACWHLRGGAICSLRITNTFTTTILE